MLDRPTFIVWPGLYLLNKKKIGPQCVLGVLCLVYLHSAHHASKRDWLKISGRALGFFNLGPGTPMFGQIGVPSIFGGSQNLGDSLREKEYVLDYEKKRVTNLELILTHMHMHWTGRQRLFREPLHSFLHKNSVNERAPFLRVYASLVSFLRSDEQ